MKPQADLEDLACFLDWNATHVKNPKHKRKGYSSAAELLWWITGHLEHPMLDEMMEEAIAYRHNAKRRPKKNVTEDAFAI